MSQSPDEVLGKLIDSAAPGLQADEKGKLRSDAEAYLKNSNVREMFEDFKKIAYASGIHAAQIVLRQLVDVGADQIGISTGEQLRAVIDKYNEEEFMGRSIKFGPELKEFKDVEFALMIDVCDKDHDLSEQIKQISALPEREMKKIKTEMGVLVASVRAVYQMISVKDPQLFTAIHARLGKDYPSARVESLLVDPKNTTLYVIESLPRRVGIYLRRK